MRTHGLVLALALAPALAGRLPAQGDKKADIPEQELAALKKQRDLANDFMRRATERALKEPAKGDKEKSGHEKAARETLQKRLAPPRYFGSGTGPEELARFRSLLQEADKEGVKLTDQALHELIRAAVLHRLDDKALKQDAEEVRKQHEGATDETIHRALSAEFRGRSNHDPNDAKHQE